ncbi:MAG: hypothetical protein J6Y13_04820 [Treponema sp.]|nr:hypothetical protein [Treponema sp.]
MTNAAFQAIQDYKNAVAAQVQRYAPLSAELIRLSSEASADDTPAYSHDTPVVYNTAWDAITEADDIRLIVVGDNPGKEEQLLSRRAYLVGQSGRVAEGFFRRNPSLGIDFRRNTLITNKTPIHTAKTKHLKHLAAKGSPALVQALEESQREMARLTARLHRQLYAESGAKLYLVGYAELKGRGLFLPYRDELARSYAGDDAAWDAVYVYQHFSMNRFQIDLTDFMAASGEGDMTAALGELGRRHKGDIWPPSAEAGA